MLLISALDGRLASFGPDYVACVPLHRSSSDQGELRLFRLQRARHSTPEVALNLLITMVVQMIGVSRQLPGLTSGHVGVSRHGPHHLDRVR